MTDRIDIRREEGGRLGRIALSTGPLNILTRDDITALREAIAACDDCAVILIEARGERAFCAGVEVADHTPDRAPAMLEAFEAFASGVRAAEPFIVCAVAAPALGGGFELALLADLVICSTAASFALPEVQLAALPPIACALLPGMIGERRALDLIVTGRRIDAETAYDWGLVHRVTDPGALADSALELCRRLLGYSSSALRACKRATRAASLDGAMRIYRDDVLPTHDAAEGINAFLEKRPPAWSHTRTALETTR